MNVVEESPMAATATAAPVMNEPAAADDEDDTLSYFAKLAKES